ncbi:DNA repair protein RecO [Sneathiella chinensis]|uniref:DNA repair protein RecO n=1 Tax=Sneathiella chinensis TaxID=349750 RepID=A0ABQ5U5B8_9PROT|nr:DNA repair protein RecO [Sneathiella chinensis]GLQ06438.1 DNA repair protein RecO [Sneathiella chinensis]
MQWNDEGLVLSARKYGENSVILHALTREHGRYAGMVRGGTGKRLRGILQPGNEVGLGWNSRLADQLGTFSVEARRSLATLLFDRPLNLLACGSVTALLEIVLPEREPHPPLFEATRYLLEQLSGDLDIWGPLLVRWELGLLRELGYGLDLGRCAATGSTEDLVFVSPKSGRAVSRAAGEIYKQRLLPLPGFLSPEGGEAESADLVAGLTLSGYFIQKFLLPNYGNVVLSTRERFIDALRRRNI